MVSPLPAGYNPDVRCRLLVWFTCSWLLAPTASAQLGGGDAPLGEQEHVEEPGNEGTLSDDFVAIWPERDAQLPLNGVLYVELRWPTLQASVAQGATSLDVRPQLLTSDCGHSCVFAVPLPRSLTDKGELLAVHLQTERNEEQRTLRPGPFADEDAPRVIGQPAAVAQRTVVRGLLGEVLSDTVTLEVTLLPGEDEGGGVGAWLLYAGAPGVEPALKAARVVRTACPLCPVTLSDVGVGDGQTCVSVVALDGAGNRSERSAPVCVDVPEEDPGLPFGCAQGQGGLAASAPLAALLGLLAVRRRRGTRPARFRPSP